MSCGGDRCSGLRDKSETEPAKPDGDTSKLLRHVVKTGATPLAQTNDDTRFAAAVAAFGMLLGKSQYLGDYPYDAAIDLAKAAKGKDDDGLRAECINLMKTARDLTATQPKSQPARAIE